MTAQQGSASVFVYFINKVVIMFVLLSTHETVLHKLKIALSEIEDLKNQIKNMKKASYDNEVQQNVVSLDFDAMKAFSIERLPSDQTTVVGYLDCNDKVCEWKLFINLQSHEYLVSQFNLWAKNNNKNGVACSAPTLLQK